MPITTSAKKALRQSKRKRTRNLVYLNKIRLLMGEFKKLASAKKVEEAKAMLPRIYKTLDKATKEHIIHKNKASRKKSRMTVLVNKLSAKK